MIDDIRGQALDLFFGRNGTRCDYREAFHLFSKIRDEPCALSAAACMYECAIILEHNLKKALGYYKKAAEKGDIFAKYRLGHMHQFGIGTFMDIEKAFTLYSEASEQGSPDAMYGLGTLYRYAFGMIDPVRSKELFERSAELGNPYAMYELGSMYERGLMDKNGSEIVPKDDVLSKEWYGRSIAALTSSAENGDIVSLMDLSDMYIKGDHVKKDPFKAMELLIEAEEQGSHLATYRIGMIFEASNDEGAGMKKAVGYYTEAADKGVIPALYRLAELYREGEYLEKDADRAASLYREAADRGDLLAKREANVYEIYGDTDDII